MPTYAIGDIHGCLEELEILIKKLETQENFSEEDTLVFVGDYIDRGPDSKGVIDYLLRLKERYNCIFLMGNHEDMLLWYLGIDHGRQLISTGRSMQFGSAWLPNGGRQTLESYGIPDLMDFHKTYRDHFREKIQEIIGEKHIDFLKELKYYYIQGSNLFVHAGIGARAYDCTTPEEAIEWSTDEDLLWDREAFHYPNFFGTIIYGHTPHRDGVRWSRRRTDGSFYAVGIDVGTVFKANPLTAVRVDDWAEIK